MSTIKLSNVDLGIGALRALYAEFEKSYQAGTQTEAQAEQQLDVAIELQAASDALSERDLKGIARLAGFVRKTATRTLRAEFGLTESEAAELVKGFALAEREERAAERARNAEAKAKRLAGQNRRTYGGPSKRQVQGKSLVNA